jgi:uncharacterized DUF497 family protein
MATEETQPPTDPLAGCVGFEWDEGNANKSRERHGVSHMESEEMFFFDPLIVSPDSKHSGHEARYLALGQTAAGRRLFAVFTIRRDRIRVISTRPMSRQERRVYEQARQAGKAQSS